MARANQICKHPKRDEIDRAIAKGIPQRTIADQYDITKTSLVRYIKNGCPDGDLSPKEAMRQKIAEGNEERALEGIAIATDALDRLTKASDAAMKAGQFGSSVAAAKGMIEIAKLVGVRTGGTGDGSGLTTALEKIGKAAWKEEEAK